MQSFVLALAITSALAAPVPKALQQTQQKRVQELRQKYADLQKELGNSANGLRLRFEIAQAKAMAEEMNSARKLDDPTRRERTLSLLGQSFKEEMAKSPHLAELYEIATDDLVRGKDEK